ncbi:MAG: hypothetical protein K1X29_06370 [Bdellovibrionales bacterium]|nr:hypothetical protein [Bdellovibrionales bacterium]
MILQKIIEECPFSDYSIHSFASVCKKTRACCRRVIATGS